MAQRIAFLVLLMISAGRLASAGDRPIRLNEIQVIGTHNSYHIAPHPNVLGLIAAAAPRQAAALDYTHPPIAQQLSRLGIRQIELDVFADPEGGHYAKPSARQVLERAGKDPGPDPDAGGRLRAPGLKVLHVPDVDFQSTAATFVDALNEVSRWSRANPRHVPIMILVELKDEAIPTLPTRPVAFSKSELDRVDDEIRAVFERSRILTPDDIRGASATLPEALRDRGWPTLDSARGKVLFALDNEGALRDRYLEGHRALEGRAMFVSVPASHPAAAWMKMNDPVRDFERIRTLVKDGFLVRTRADADTTQARRNDGSQRDKALASGAQFVSTDYPEPRAEFSSYQVRLPGDARARANPVNGQAKHGDADLEGPLK
jgi:hypothetical protein